MVFGHITQKKKKILRRLEGISREQERNWSHSLSLLETEVKQELLETLTQEELFWHQKSPRKWIRDGDRNTRFFNISIIHRRNRNKIDHLQNDLEEWIGDRQ